MGASITTIPRMSKKSKTRKEQYRRKNCVSKAYKESNRQGVKVNEFDVSVSAEKGPVSGTASTTVGGWGYESEEGFGNRSSQCDANRDSYSQSNENYLHQSEVIAIGALPYDNRDIWIKQTKVSPSPVDFRLESITDLFTTINLKDIPLDPNDEDGEKLDANLLKTYHQDTMENYCDIMLGAPCPVVKGCHIWNDCDIDEICVDENSERGFFCRKCQCQENEICELNKSLKQFKCVRKG